MPAGVLSGHVSIRCRLEQCWRYMPSVKLIDHFGVVKGIPAVPCQLREPRRGEVESKVKATSRVTRSPYLMTSALTLSAVGAPTAGRTGGSCAGVSDTIVVRGPLCDGLQLRARKAGGGYRVCCRRHQRPARSALGRSARSSFRTLVPHERGERPVTRQWSSGSLSLWCAQPSTLCGRSWPSFRSYRWW